MPSFLTDVFSPAGGLADLSGGSDAVFGSKPRVAPFVPVDLATEQGKAVSTNLGAYDSITELLNKVIPGFSDSLEGGTATAQNILGSANDLIAAGLPLLQGKLPEGAAGEIQRSSAFQSLLGGFGGTPMAEANDVRNYGKSVFDAIGLGGNLLGQGAQVGAIGTNSAQQWANIAEQGYSPFFISTPEQASTTAANNAGQQATDQFKYNVAAAPDPAAQGMFNTNVAIGQQIMGIIGGIFGGGSGSQATARPVTGMNWGYPNIQQGSGYVYNPQTGSFTTGGGWG